MRIANIFNLLGGLALFLYGMQMMSRGLEATAGSRMKKILERLTSNRFLGVAVGAGITAVIQSSSATTVMVVGFVNSGMMALGQAVWVIMGANIGTTVTGQLIALDVGIIAPLLAFLGVAPVVFMKKALFRNYGTIVAGLGILFIGMGMMSAAMQPLKDSQTFINIMTRFDNPLLGILAGALFTAVIQSSSASVGILQALAVGGLIGLPSAVYVLFGQNIGTCITAVIASIGTCRNAKRTTLIHLSFNLIGTAIFTVICMLTPLTAMVERITPQNPAAQIANMHTLFNVVTTLLLMPFGLQLARLSKIILPDKPETFGSDGHRLMYISSFDSAPEYGLGNVAIALNSVMSEIKRMTEMTRKNVELSFDAVLNGNCDYLDKVASEEEYIDYLNSEISKYISHIMTCEKNEQNSDALSSLFKISGDLERISDHAVNICEYTVLLTKKGISFSDDARREIMQMKHVCMLAMGMLQDNVKAEMQLAVISDFEQEIDNMKLKYRQNQLCRLKEGVCSGEACVIYSEMLTDFERIGDHILNIGQELYSSSSIR